jgi:CRISPR-associated protein Cmr2
VKGKNALAVTMSKRSGEDYSIAGQWNKLDTRLQQLIGFYRKGAIPVGTAYELRDLVRRLGVPIHDAHTKAEEEAATQSLADVIQTDALRILQRKLHVPLGKFPRGQAEEVENFFKARLDNIKQEARSDMNLLPGLINELIIAQMIADAQQLATPEKKESRL